MMMVQHKHGTWILLATILGSSMVFIDSSVVKVALPRLQTDLTASVTSVQWVVEVYILFLAALMLDGDRIRSSPTSALCSLLLIAPRRDSKMCIENV